MGRVVLWTAAVCSVLIALNTNAVGWTTTSTSSKTEAKPPGQEYSHSFGDLIKKLTKDLRSVLTSIKKLAINTEIEILKKTKEFAKPLIERLVKQKEEEFQYAASELYEIVNNYIQNINTTRNILREIIQNGIDKLKQLNKGKFIADIQQIIQEKEYKLTGILVGLNFTKDPLLFKELLEAIYNYPQSKDDLGLLLKKSFINTIFEIYMELSNKLKCEIKAEISNIIKYIENYMTTNDESGSDADNFITIESGRVIEGAIDALIDKLFKDADKLNKEKLDHAIYLDKNVIISIGNTDPLV